MQFKLTGVLRKMGSKEGKEDPVTGHREAATILVTLELPISRSTGDLAMVPEPGGGNRDQAATGGTGRGP